MTNSLYRGAHHFEDDEVTNEVLDAVNETIEQREEGIVQETPEPQKPTNNPEEDTFKKRYGDLRRHSEKEKAELKGRITALERQLEQMAHQTTGLPTSVASEEELVQWMREYPDVARIVETIAAKKADEKVSHVDKRLEQIAERERATEKRAAEIELKRLHPDIAEIQGSRAFHEWAEKQPKWVKDALYVNETDAFAAARAIDLYKADVGLSAKTKKREEPKEASLAVPKSSRSEPTQTDGKRRWKESEIAKLNSRQFDDLEDEIMTARREGRIIYDISGGAM